MIIAIIGCCQLQVIMTLQYDFKVDPPFYIIIYGGLQLGSLRYVAFTIILASLIFSWLCCLLPMRYAKHHLNNVILDARWLNCSGRVGDSIGVGWLLLRRPQNGRWSTTNHVKYCIFLKWNNWAFPQHWSIILRIYLYPNICLGVVEGWADCWAVKMSTSGLGAVINVLVVGDAKYSAKIDTIGAALIDEGIWCDRARLST